MLAAGLLLAARVHAEAPPCGPFELAAAGAADAANAEPGVAPADAGTIAKLPEPVAVDGSAPRGEALLALPKTASGGLPTGVELAPGARIASSYWSPVLCATVARVVGPPELTPAQLVPGLPDGAALTPNSVYASAQAEVKPLGQPAAGSADPYRPLQYALDQLGVERARAVTNGAGVRVALLDSAPDVSHADLPRIEIAPVEGGPETRAAMHGTLVAGVLAAREHNGIGIAGVAPGAALVAVPVCTPEGASASDRCLLYDLLRGVDVAWSRDAAVMNLSLVGPDNPLLARAMDRLDRLGVLVVAAAGNEGTASPRYPAAYPSVIGVGASDRDKRVHARSNRGLSAELYAPGVEVLSSIPGSSYAFGTGTSFAAAQVSGELALLIGAGFTPAQARTALFHEANTAGENADAVLLPPLCDVLQRLGKACPP